MNSISEVRGGWDSDVLVVNERWIFRLPKRPEVKEWITTEISLLPQLDRVLPVPVPRFEFVCPEHGVVGYTKIEGTPLIRGLFPNVAMKRLARQLGAFLTALHRFPVSRARELGASGGGPQTWRNDHSDSCRRLLSAVLPLLEPKEQEVAKAMIEVFLSDDANFSFSPTLIHADLGPEHILCRSSGEIAGVIDWSDARVGDPALDFAWLLHGLGESSARSLLDAYEPEVDASFLRRALFYHGLGPWHEVRYGIDTGQRSFVDRGLRGIRSRLPTT